MVPEEIYFRDTLELEGVEDLLKKTNQADKERKEKTELRKRKSEQVLTKQHNKRSKKTLDLIYQ